MEFVFENNINPNPDNFLSIDNLEQQILKKTSDIKNINDYENIYSGIDNLLEKNFSSPENIIEKYRIKWKQRYSNYHQGYLWYLYSAYMSDSGIEIAPWYLYNVILHQIAQVIKDNVEEYRNIFTSSQEKITIKMDTSELDIKYYTSLIKKLIPDSDIFDTFFPSWTETPLYYNECIQGLFSDMVQKYYAAFVYGCSCPKVRVKGTQDDWNNLSDTIVKLNNIFNNNNSHSLDKYLNKVINYLDNLKNNWNKPETWENFFYIKNCGSGHQEGVGGTIYNLLNYDGYEMLLHQLPNTLSRFPFQTNDPKQKDSYFLSGIVGSNLDSDGYLVPFYDYSITWIDYEEGKLEQTKLNEYQWLKEQLENLERISPNDEYLKHHFIHNNEIYSKFLDDKNYLDEKKLEIIKLGDEAINKYLNDKLEDKLRFYRELIEDGISPWFDEPKFEEIKDEFEKIRINGTKKEYSKKKEKERLEKIITDSTFNHIWFEGINNIEPFEYWNNNTTAILTLTQYNKQISKVNEFTSKLLDKEYLQKVYNLISELNKILNTKYKLSNIIYGTLNINIIKLYIELFPSESEYLTKIIFANLIDNDDDLRFAKCINKISYFTFDNDLKEYLLKIFSKELNILLNNKLDLEINYNKKEVEKFNTNIKDSTKKGFIKHYKTKIDNLTRINLKILELKNKLNSNITIKNMN